MTNPLRYIGSFFSKAANDAASFIGKVSPYVLQAMRPILLSAGEDVWKVAYPLAQQIVQDVAKRGLSGFDAHTVAVKELEAAVVASGKLIVTATTKLHFGQIILAAYANSPVILAVLTAAAVVL